MEFESARELKEIAVAQYGATSGARASAVGRAVGKVTGIVGSAIFEAARLSEHLPIPTFDASGLSLFRDASIGFGIAIDEKENCRLAVRYPWVDRSRRPFFEDFENMTNGELDVEWTGPIVAAVGPATWHRDRCRPLKMGASVAHADGTAGTITGFVRRGGGAPELLSCNHVLADCGKVSADAAIIQPGPSDEGKATDVIGRLGYVHPLNRQSMNIVDCATATLNTGVTIDSTTLDGYGDLAGGVDPDWYGKTAEGKAVAKIGRSTETTTGRVSVVSFKQEVDYKDWGWCSFDDLIEIKGDGDHPFTELGDSGALVFTPAERLAVGMFIAQTPMNSYATRMDAVLARLGADLVT